MKSVYEKLEDAVALTIASTILGAIIITCAYITGLIFVDIFDKLTTTVLPSITVYHVVALVVCFLTGFTALKIIEWYEERSDSE